MVVLQGSLAAFRRVGSDGDSSGSDGFQQDQDRGSSEDGSGYLFKQDESEVD